MRIRTGVSGAGRGIVRAKRTYALGGASASQIHWAVVKGNALVPFQCDFDMIG